MSKSRGPFFLNVKQSRDQGAIITAQINIKITLEAEK